LLDAHDAVGRWLAPLRCRFPIALGFGEPRGVGKHTPHQLGISPPERKPKILLGHGSRGVAGVFTGHGVGRCGLPGSKNEELDPARGRLLAHKSPASERMAPDVKSAGMAKADVTREDVLKAIAEFDELGQEAFLDKYHMGKATAYRLHSGGKEYDSKAILAAAHGFHPGLAPLAAGEFSGGENDAVKVLRRLGFVVPPTREPTWARDELILACDLVRDNGWKGLGANDPRVQELSDLLQQLPIHPMEVRGPKFRNPNGVGRKTWDIATHHPDYRGAPTNAGTTDLEVLRGFLEREDEMRQAAQLIRDGISSGELVDVTEDVLDVDDLDDGEATEGRLLERRHFARERDRNLRAKKIARHLQRHSELACEICGFDFRAVYGDHGVGYIECHHTTPLHASGETKTKLNDLILVCANCHRMIHRRNPWLTAEQLRVFIEANQAPSAGHTRERH
jgi:5-methylcytosine-specific restriction enzyme A